MRSTPTVAQLRAFVAVAEFAHFKDAAASLGVSQPTLSQSLAAMETRLGVKLIERNPRKVLVTAEGRFLLPLARQMLHLVDDGDGVLLLSDLFGATPSNLALKLLEPGRVEGLTGVNLPMLLRALNYRDKGMSTLLVRARDGGRDGILNMLDH